MKYKIPFIKPHFPDAKGLSEDYINIVESNWYTNFGPYEKEFSTKAAAFIGDNIYATTIANCTLGLEAAMAVLFDSSKSTVIIPSFTFASGVEAIIRSGYSPVFIDIDAVSLQPDYNQAKQVIEKEGPNIAGILLCNIFGVGNKEIEKWESLARNNNISLVVDSAAGFGSMYSLDEMVGSRGDCEVFSMHATKPFAIGEGGLVTSKNEDIIKNIRTFQNFGFGKDKNIHIFGTNAKLQEINCAIGLRQLRNYKERLSNRRKILKKYKTLLPDKDYKFQFNDDLSTVPFVSVLIKDPALADIVYDNLHSNGVEARRYYSPLHLQRILLEYRTDTNINLQNTEDIASRIISLPVHDNMSDESVEYIVRIIKSTIEK